MPKTYRAALIGCGRMGATIDDEVRDHPNSFLWLPYSHAAGYVACERTELIAVSDPIAEKVAQIQARYSVPAGYTDYRELIEQEHPDIISVATRPGPHAEIVEFAADHGVRGIYCEKPLCSSMREADAMRAACERHGVKFNYGTQRRYMPLYQTMRGLIDAGELGTVNAVIGYCGVGSAQWSHTHAADMLLYLAGDGEVEYVQGTALTKDADWEGSHLTSDPGIASAYVRFRNGVHGYLVAAGGYEFEVSGPKGKLRSLENGASVQWRRVEGPHNLMVDVPFPEYARASGTVRGIEDIVAALDSGGETLGNIGIASRSQEIILSIVESSRQGGARVSLPLENRDLKVARKDW